MIDLLIDHDCVAEVAAQYCGRKQQQTARRAVLRHVAGELVGLGVTDFLIEAVLESDPGRFDRPVMYAACDRKGQAAAASYGWGTKLEPTLWLADAICGAAANHIRAPPSVHFDRLFKAGVLASPVFVT